MEVFVLPRANGAHPHDRIADDGIPGKRAPNAARFHHGQTIWRVEGDTRFEPLLMAWCEIEGPSATEPFCFREEGQWALALRPDLHAKQTFPGDRGAGGLFIYASKRQGKPALPHLPSLREQRAHVVPYGRQWGPVPFRPDVVPGLAALPTTADPARAAALIEKANQGHHAILVRLFRRLTEAGWQEIGEFPGSIDLWARRPDGQRVIFEAKTVSETNSLSQCRRGLAQLLEYRLEFGEEEDRLCLVTDVPIPPDRASILDRLGIAAVAVTAEDEVVVSGGNRGTDLAVDLESARRETRAVRSVAASEDRSPNAH